MTPNEVVQPGAALGGYPDVRLDKHESRRVSAANIRMQLIYCMRLVGNNRTHQVTDRDDSDEIPPVENRKMPNSVFRDDSHTFIDGIFGGYGDQ